jgi:glycosyltransferase involved in cell wall biosynthesis
MVKDGHRQRRPGNAATMLTAIATPDGVVVGAHVSVVVAVYDNLQYLPETLAAIDAQTEPPGEVVIVDDASPHDVRAVVRSAAIAVPVRYIRREVNGGVAVARNAGNAAATGDWIAVCDSDDVWMPEKLERQLKLINSWNDAEPLVAVGADAMNVNRRGEPFGVFPGSIYTKGTYLEHVASDRPFIMCHSSVLYRRDAFDRCGGYPTHTTPVTVDTELLTNLASAGVVLTMPEVMVSFRKHDSSQSMSWTSVRDQHASLLRIEENMRRTRLGMAPVDPREFAHMRAARSRSERYREFKYCVGKSLYRSGAVKIANGRSFPGGLRLALAFLLVPRQVISGVKRKLRLGT